MSFVVVTDSTADLSAEIAERNGIEVVPLSVNFDGDSITDGAISQEEFFERMGKSSALPTTSQPPVGAFAETYKRLLETSDEIISVHISNKLSGTIESARQAAKQFEGRVHVFDSYNLSWALGFQVIEAARAAAEGLTVAAALDRLKGARERVRLIVGLDSLDNLARGGRIGKVSAFLGSILDLKVTLSVDPEGAFFPVARSRGEKAALRHTLDWIAQQLPEGRAGKFAVGYALQPERAEWLVEHIVARFGAQDVIVYPTGAVIAAHTGTGWGVAVLPDE